MPRLVLYEDNGRVLFESDVTRENVHIVARFIRRHMGIFQMVAQVRQAWRQAVGALADQRPPRPLRRRRRA